MSQLKLSMNAADESEHESTESDDEFQICQICNVEEVLLFIYCFNNLNGPVSSN